MNKIIVGITLDWEDSKTYSSYCPWYGLRDNYAKVISRAGATPIMIPYDLTSIKEYINIIDALVISGGDYDLSPTHYDDELKSQTRTLKENRVLFETSLINAAIKKRIPILGICAGMQLMAVKIGKGKLIQDIISDGYINICHEQKIKNIHPSKPIHSVIIDKDSYLYKILGKEKIEVNSTHHQAVKEINSDFRISAKAPDGIIEAIEHKDYPFMVGVEWHPEYEVTEDDTNIFKEFISVARNGRL